MPPMSMRKCRSPAASRSCNASSTSTAVSVSSRPASASTRTVPCCSWRISIAMTGSAFAEHEARGADLDHVLVGQQAFADFFRVDARTVLAAEIDQRETGHAHRDLRVLRVHAGAADADVVGTVGADVHRLERQRVALLAGLGILRHEPRGAEDLRRAAGDGRRRRGRGFRRFGDVDRAHDLGLVRRRVACHRWHLVGARLGGCGGAGWSRWMRWGVLGGAWGGHGGAWWGRGSEAARWAPLIAAKLPVLSA